MSDQSARQAWRPYTLYSVEELDRWLLPEENLFCLEWHDQAGLYLGIVSTLRNVPVWFHETQGELGEPVLCDRVTYRDVALGTGYADNITLPQWQEPFSVLMTALRLGRPVYTRIPEVAAHLREILIPPPNVPPILDHQGQPLDTAPLLGVVRWDEEPPFPPILPPGGEWREWQPTPEALPPDGRTALTLPEGEKQGPQSAKKAQRINPGPLPIQTGEEARTLEEAIACAPHRIGYQFTQPTGGQPIARYSNPSRKGGYEVLISPPSGEAWGMSELQAMTGRWDLFAVHAQMVVTAMLAANAVKHADGIARGEVKPSITVEVDEILEAMGRRRVDGAAKWNQARCMIRQRLLEISYAAVVGQRKKTYMDKATNAKIDTYQNEALFVVHDQETEWLYGQRSFDGSGIPVRLVIVGGSLWQRMARYDQMRQYIGEVRHLAKLPIGQPSGQWAFCILRAALQMAREKRTRRFEATRGELLLTFPPDETPQQLWDKGKTDKIKPRWGDAERLLRREVGLLLTEPPPLDVARRWLEPYLAQKVLVEVSESLMGDADLPALAATAASHAAKEGKRKPGRPRKNPLAIH